MSLVGICICRDCRDSDASDTTQPAFSGPDSFIKMFKKTAIIFQGLDYMYTTEEVWGVILLYRMAHYYVFP